jgi:hypothetical protein
MPGVTNINSKPASSSRRSTTRQILALRDKLVDEGVGMVVIESTGTYWKPLVRSEALWNRVEVR